MAQVIKDRARNVLTSEENVRRRWEYAEELMNEDNVRERSVDNVETVEREVGNIGRDEVIEQI